MFDLKQRKQLHSHIWISWRSLDRLWFMAGVNALELKFLNMFCCFSFGQFLTLETFIYRVKAMHWTGQESCLCENSVFFAMYKFVISHHCPPSPQVSVGDDWVDWLIYVHGWVLQAGVTIGIGWDKSRGTDPTKSDWKKVGNIDMQQVEQPKKIFFNI